VVNVVSIAKFRVPTSRIIATAILGFVLSLNIGGGVETFGSRFKSAPTKLVCLEYKRIIGASRSFKFSNALFVGSSPLAGVFLNALFVSLIPRAFIFASAFFVIGISKPFFSIDALYFAKMISVGNSPIEMSLSNAFRVGNSPFAPGFPFALRVGLVVGLSALYLALTVGIVIILIALIKSLFVDGVPLVFVFDKMFSAGIGKFTKAHIATLFASTLNAIATILVGNKVFTCGGFTLTALGAILLGHVCDIMEMHRNSPFVAKPGTPQTSPGTLYWFTPVSIAHYGAVNQ